MKKLVKESLIETSNNSSLNGIYLDIESDTIQNKYFRKVIYSGKNLQLVLMTLKPNEDIGMEIHQNIDQFFRIESGSGKCIINDNEYTIKDGDAIIIPAGAEHNIIASEKTELKMYTIYAPPHHKDGVEFLTKEDADISDEEFDGKITE